MKTKTKQFKYNGMCTLGDYTIEYYGDEVEWYETVHNGNPAILFINPILTSHSLNVLGRIVLDEKEDSLCVIELQIIKFIVKDKKVKLVFNDIF